MARKWKTSEWLEFIHQFRTFDLGQERDELLRATFGSGGTSDLLDALLWRIEQPDELFRHDVSALVLPSSSAQYTEIDNIAANIHPSTLKINLLLFLQEQIFSLVHDAATIEQVCTSLDALFDKAPPFSSSSSSSSQSDDSPPDNQAEILHFFLAELAVIVQTLVVLYVELDVYRRNPRLLDAFVARLLHLLVSTQDHQAPAQHPQSQGRPLSSFSQSSSSSSSSSSTTSNAALAAGSPSPYGTSGQTRLFRQQIASALEELELVYPGLLLPSFGLLSRVVANEKTHIVQSLTTLIAAVLRNAPTVLHQQFSGKMPPADATLFNLPSHPHPSSTPVESSSSTPTTNNSLIDNSLDNNPDKNKNNQKVTVSSSIFPLYFEADLTASLQLIADKVPLMTEWGALQFLSLLHHYLARYPRYAPKVLSVFHLCFRYPLWATHHMPLLHQLLAFLSSLVAALQPAPGLPDPSSIAALQPSFRVLASRLAHLSVGNPLFYPLDMQLQALHWVASSGDFRVTCYVAIADMVPSPFDLPVALAPKFAIICSPQTRGRLTGHFRILHSLMRDFEFFDECHPHALLFFHLLAHSYAVLPPDECQPSSKFLLQLLGLSTKWLMPVIRLISKILTTAAKPIRKFIEHLLVTFFETLAVDQLQHYLPLLVALATQNLSLSSFSPQLTVKSLSKMIKHPSFNVDSWLNRSLLLGALSVLVCAHPIHPIFHDLSALLETCTFLAPHYLDFVDQLAILLRMLSRVRQKTIRQLMDLSPPKAVVPPPDPAYRPSQNPAGLSDSFPQLPQFLDFQRDPTRPLTLQLLPPENEIHPVDQSLFAFHIPCTVSYPSAQAHIGILYAVVLNFADQPGFYFPISPIRLPFIRPGEAKPCTLVLMPHFPMAAQLRSTLAFTDAQGHSYLTNLPPLPIDFHDLLIPHSKMTSSETPTKLLANNECFVKTYYVTGIREEFTPLFESALLPTSDHSQLQYSFGLPPHVNVLCFYTPTEGIVKLSTQFWPISGYLDSWCDRYFFIQTRDRKKLFEL